jgi:hypothetical protein
MTVSHGSPRLAGCLPTPVDTLADPTHLYRHHGLAHPQPPEAHRGTTYTQPVADQHEQHRRVPRVKIKPISCTPPATEASH